MFLKYVTKWNLNHIRCVISGGAHRKNVHWKNGQGNQILGKIQKWNEWRVEFDDTNFENKGKNTEIYYKISGITYKKKDEKSKIYYRIKSLKRIYFKSWCLFVWEIQII